VSIETPGREIRTRFRDTLRALELLSDEVSESEITGADRNAVTAGRTDEELLDAYSRAVITAA
jgi:hypothetical protein